MATLQAKRIKDALQKVKRVGRIEESVTVAGCELVVQNLSPDEMEGAIRDLEGLEDIAYANAYQMEQVCRAIVEINGQDLRDAEYIEDDVPAGKFVLELVLSSKAAGAEAAAKLRELKFQPTLTQVEDGQIKTIKLERSAWLKQNVLKDWGREALTVVWRKFTETLIKADEVAKQGVQFSVPDETPEDKFRRHLNSLREIEEEMPDDLTNKLLDEAGLLKKSRREELEAVNDRMAKLQEAPPPVAAPVASVPTAPQEEPPTRSIETGAFVPPQAVQEAMAARQRMNNQGGDVPVPTPPAESLAVAASPRARVPDHIREAAKAATQSLQGRAEGISTRSARTDRIAALEAQAGLPDVEDDGAQVMPARRGAGDVVEIKKEPPVDGDGLRSIVDRPPSPQVNARFQPSPRNK